MNLCQRLVDILHRWLDYLDEAQDECSGPDYWPINPEWPDRPKDIMLSDTSSHVEWIRHYETCSVCAGVNVFCPAGRKKFIQSFANHWASAGWLFEWVESTIK